MRAFFAIEVPGIELPPGAPVSVPAAPVHLTLRFFEALDEGRLPALTAAADRAVIDLPAFPLAVEGVGTFPETGTPRLVWAGISQGRDEVERLTEALSSALAEIGLERDARPFFPHVTLWRVRRSADQERAREWKNRFSDTRFGATMVREVVLKESALNRHGAVHRVVHRSALARPYGAPPPEAERREVP